MNMTEAPHPRGRRAPPSTFSRDNEANSQEIHPAITRRSQTFSGGQQWRGASTRRRRDKEVITKRDAPRISRKVAWSPPPLGLRVDQALNASRVATTASSPSARLPAKRQETQASRREVCRSLTTKQDIIRKVLRSDLSSVIRFLLSARRRRLSYSARLRRVRTE